MPRTYSLIHHVGLYRAFLPQKRSLISIKDFFDLSTIEQDQVYRQAPTSSLSATEFFEHDYKSFCSRATIQDENLQGLIPDWSISTDVAVGVQVPDSLLQAPWMEDKIRHLFWLAKSGAGVNFVSSTSGEVSCSKR